MSEMTVGVRDLRARLSEYLRLVRNGQTIIITDRGREVGRILPAEKPLEERLQALQDAGLLAWNGQTLGEIEPPAVNRSEHLLSDLIVEMRQ